MSGTTQTKTPPVVSAQDWRAAREEMLIEEKEVMRARDALATQRRWMSWLAVDKDYVFEGPTTCLTSRI